MVDSPIRLTFCMQLFRAITIHEYFKPWRILCYVVDKLT